MAIIIPIILNRPITFWLGIALIFALFATLATGVVLKKGFFNLSLKYHVFAASITLIIAAIHAFFGILTYV